jgi:RimJ/RimL family protein N-acetyltransferase
VTNQGVPAGQPAGVGNVLSTARLVLREVPFAEIAAILDGRPVLGANWAEGYPFEGTIGGATLASRMVETGTYRPGFGIYQIMLCDAARVVGDIGFHSAPDGNGSVALGYGLVEAYRGKGIATEATQALVVWALRQPGVLEVCAETEVANAASQRVLVKSGFREVGSDGKTRRFVRHCA